jgi:hypothetical protein
MSKELIARLNQSMTDLESANMMNTKERATAVMSDMLAIFEQQQKLNDATLKLLNEGFRHRVELQKALNHLDQVLIVEGVKSGAVLK